VYAILFVASHSGSAAVVKYISRLLYHMDDKIAKLQAATDNAKSDLERCKESLEESERAVLVAKALLREMDEADQHNLKITDTKLPELLAMHHAAKDSFEIAAKRYETNKRYLNIYKQHHQNETN
jgi:hypothetical protein